MAARNSGIKIKQQPFKLSQFLAFEFDWEGLVDFLQEEGFIPDSKICLHCGQNLVVQESNKNKDGCIWR